MKKLITLILGAFMVFAVAGTASAAFEYGDLTLVIYSEGDTEIGLNLGTLSTMDLTAKNVELFAAGSWSLDDFNVADTYGDLNVGLMGFNTSPLAIYFGATTTVGPDVSITAYNSYSSNYSKTLNYYNGLDDGNDGIAIASATNNQSYDMTVNANSAAPGSYNGFNNDPGNGEGQFDDTLGYVDMYLFGYAPGLVPGADGDYQAVIRVFDDGSVVLNPTVPVPGAGILMGAGLLTLVGLRRKN